MLLRRLSPIMFQRLFERQKLPTTRLLYRTGVVSLKFPLFTGHPGIIVGVCVCLLSIAHSVHAQSADDLAIPVRKGASEKADKSEKTDKTEKTGNSDKTEKTRKSEKTDQSAKSEKKTEQSAKSEKTEKSEKSEKSAKSENSKLARANKSDQSEKSSSKNDPDLAAVANLRPKAVSSATSEDDAEVETDEIVGPSDDDIPQPSQIASVALPPMAPVSATVPARISPNLYLPQSEPEKSGGFLSRLLGRQKKSEAATTPLTAPASASTRQSNFTSDYAKRDGGMILPAVLDGNGWNGVDLPIGGEDPYRLASLPSSFRPTDLVKLPVQTCHYGNQLYLRREAAIALMNMINAAACEGLTLRVVSAFRDNGHQTRLYNRAVARGGEDQKSVARPGKSEHNLGTTVDLTNNETHALNRSFGNTPEGRWLAINAGSYGYKMTVMSENARRSHNEEPWHLRYLGSSLNGSAAPSTIAQQNSPSQSRDIFGSIGRFLHLRK